jgi:DNA polymerase III gamma/tau subunit
MPLQIKHRPKSLEEIVGNDPLKKGIQEVLDRKDIPHVFLLVGPYGTGKTTIAHILKEKLGCEDVDFYQYTSTNFRGIDTARDIIRNAPALPHGEVKIYFLEEFHGQLTATQEALLEILEFPPAHTYFILATTNPEKINPGIITRSHMYTTSLLSSHQMRSLIVRVLDEEEIGMESEVIDEVIRAAEGSARQALKLVDQVMTADSVADALALIKSISATDEDIKLLCRAIYTHETKGWTKWKEVLKCIESLGETDPEKTRRRILMYFTKALTGARDKDAAGKALKLISYFENNYYNSGRTGLISSCYMACLDI